MPLLQWKPQYSVGIEAVDHEHRELIDLINMLYDQLTEGRSKVTVEAFFGDLFKGISAHFALEERFMRERRYDQLTEHKTDHERLLDQIRDIMDDFTDAAVLDTGELATRLEAWFARHFETHDARLHKALGAHPH
jgi:hemerythrin